MGARTVGPMNELARRYPDRDLAVELDVTKADQRASAVQLSGAGQIANAEISLNKSAAVTMSALGVHRWV